ncbi:Dabb family protein [Verrucomicrobia bacterium]|nr:Dabb family protein [Verrucomicrobiota bacterium]|tara:strand:- start:20423 stop:20875 length:453 start_codon:yes stop_codon:yes gene_type:complete
MEADSFLHQSPELLNVMQMRSFIAVLTVILLGIMSFTNNTDAAGKSNQRGNLVHMVSFKFKESVTKEDIKKVETAFAGLQKKIPQILSYETGTNNSPEGLDKGFTHGFVLTFHSGQDRDDYLIHPHHKDFGKLVGPLLEDVFVVDFWNGQ